MIYFTSDWHIGHDSIIEKCKRPYRDVDAMNQNLVQAWNSVVKTGDQVFFLGDFSFCDPIPWAYRLNGERFLIIGNHDHGRMSKHKKAGWGWIKDVYELKTEVNRIWLSHYPHRSWPNSSHGAWHLHGHTHGYLDGTPLSMDVGVDPCGFKLMSLDDIVAKLLHPKELAMLSREERYERFKAPDQGRSKKDVQDRYGH